MKLTRLFTSLFAVTLCLAVLTSASFAKAKPLPLNFPSCLAVDAAGNLYVANTNANNSLIYNSGYAQQTSKTITQGLSYPQCIAIDPYGNLWAANGNSSITEYTGGVQNASNTITNGVNTPSAIAFDGLDNLWVLNEAGAVGLTIYSPTAVYGPPSNSNLVRTVTLPWSLFDQVNDIALSAGAFVFSTGSSIPLNSASATLLGGALSGPAYGLGAGALAPDNSGNVYFWSTNGNVYIAQPNLIAPFFATPTAGLAGIYGMAVDSVHKRVYMSDPSNNKIYVYSNAAGATYGTLIHTIANPAD